MVNAGASTQPHARRRFGSEKEAAYISVYSVRTLQWHRNKRREEFPWYRIGGKVLYDLEEVERIIRRSRRGGEDELAEGR